MTFRPLPGWDAERATRKGLVERTEDCRGRVFGTYRANGLNGLRHNVQ